MENLWKKYNKLVENQVLISVRMCGSQCIGVDRCCEVCYSELADIGVFVVGGVG